MPRPNPSNERHKHLDSQTSLKSCLQQTRNSVSVRGPRSEHRWTLQACVIGAGLFSLLGILLLPAGPFIATELPNAGRLLLGAVLLGLTIVFIHWLTRPSQPEINAYGPPPLA